MLIRTNKGMFVCTNKSMHNCWYSDIGAWKLREIRWSHSGRWKNKGRELLGISCRKPLIVAQLFPISLSVSHFPFLPHQLQISSKSSTLSQSLHLPHLESDNLSTSSPSNTAYLRRFNTKFGGYYRWRKYQIFSI